MIAIIIMIATTTMEAQKQNKKILVKSVKIDKEMKNKKKDICFLAFACIATFASCPVRNFSLGSLDCFALLTWLCFAYLVGCALVTFQP